ncbi:MAG TPA: glycosyltransferase family 39 protein [Streptosporangiaceae bacterium]|nr:glycosyltransferase family 39 protein [Streptosporangiaceae bacterium]
MTSPSGSSALGQTAEKAAAEQNGVTGGIEADPAQAQSASSQPAKAQASEAQTAALQVAESQANGARITDSEAAGSETAGSEAAGSETAGSEAAGSEAAAVSEVASSEAAVFESAGTRPAGTRTAGSQSAAAGSQVAGSGKAYDHGPVWALLLPPLAALALALWGITTPSYWRDEAATIAAVSRPFGDLISMLGNVDAVHSAYYMMMWPVVHLFGTGELVMRLPSALAAAAAAAFVAAIGRRVVSAWVGLAAGLLFAVLPVATRYAQEARSYEMVVAAACLASYLLIRVLGAEPDARRRWLIGYGAGLAVLGILNIFGLLLIPAHAVTVALHWWRRGGERGGDQEGGDQEGGEQRGGDRDVRRLALGWLGAAVAGVVISSPLLLLGWEQRGQVAWIANNQSSSGLSTLLTLSGSALVTIVIAGIIAIALILRTEATGARRAAWRWQLTELSVPWMLVPPALLLGASVVSPIYTSRYILMSVPAGALLGGMALVALGRIAGPVALVLVVLAGLTAQVTQRQPYGHYDNVRALDQIVAANARPGDVVLYTNPNAESFGAAYSYGLRKLPNIATKQAAIPSGTLSGTSVPLPELRSRLSHASRVWVVEINRCLSNPVTLSLSGVQQGAAIAGLPLAFTKVWHERGDWLLLYTHGAGDQQLATACTHAP